MIWELLYIPCRLRMVDDDIPACSGDPAFGANLFCIASCLLVPTLSCISIFAMAENRSNWTGFSAKLLSRFTNASLSPILDTHLRTLQIQVGLEAFLAKPDSGPVDFRDCAQVINPFIVTTKIDHCVEPTALSTYRSASIWI